PDLCPPTIAAAIKRALEKRPQERFQDMDSMARAFEAKERGRSTSFSKRAEHAPHPRAVVYAMRGREALTGLASSSSMAVELLEEAIQLDPEYALAHALHGEACAVLFNSGQLNAAWLDKAQRSLERAEQLDPTLPDLRVTRARIVWTKTFN